MSAAQFAPQPELWDSVDSRPSFEAGASSALDLPPDRGQWRDRFGAALRDWQRARLRRGPKVLSLFSGAGGLDIGFHDAGFDIVQMVELEADFVATLRANIGEGRYFPDGDPRCVDVRDYSAPFSKIDFVIGGPPCQTFSAAGRRASGVEGTGEARGMLFREYARLLADLKPRGFLFENVYGMTGAESGRSIAKVVEAFESIGYRLHLRVLDAADYGVPQHRERLIIVGLRKGEFRFPVPTHGPDSPGGAPFCPAGGALLGCTVEDAEALAVNGRHGHLLAEIPPGLNYSFFTEKLGHPRPIFAWRSKFSDYLYKADPSEPARTIKAQGGQYTGPFHWSGRRFTIEEFKRLQSFPDDYRFHGGRQRIVQQIGNSVPPHLARILACSILEQVFGAELPFDLPTLPPEAKLGFRQRKRLRTEDYRSIAQSHLKSALAAAPLSDRTLGNESIAAHGVRAGGYGFEFTGETSPGAVPSFARLEPGVWSVEVAEPNLGDGVHSWMIQGNATGNQDGLPFTRFSLRGTRLRFSQLACAWRFFERLLVERGIKDDLVQWFGYYQYRPSFELLFESSDHAADRVLGRFAEGLASGRIVRRVTPESELCATLGVGPQALRERLLEARADGFDVRTRKTNPQIPKGHFLIPYPFPTLNDQSVTGRKAIF